MICGDDGIGSDDDPTVTYIPNATFPRHVPNYHRIPGHHGASDCRGDHVTDPGQPRSAGTRMSHSPPDDATRNDDDQTENASPPICRIERQNTDNGHTDQEDDDPDDEERTAGRSECLLQEAHDAVGRIHSRASPRAIPGSAVVGRC